MLERSPVRTLKLVGAAIVGWLAAVLVGLKLHTDRLVRQAEARYPPRGRFVTVEGVRLHYVSGGTGRPVVFVHGDGGSIYDWTLSIFDRVAQGYHAVAFDRPGFGYSGRPRGGASPLAQARLIRGAIRALGLERPVLVGHSRGMTVVLAYALEYPAEIAGIVNLAGGVFHAGRWTPWYNRVLLLPVVGALLAHTVFVPFGSGLVQRNLDVVFAPEGPTPPQYLAAYVAMVLRPGPLRALADDQANAGPVIRALIPRYGELRAPLVIVNGTADRSTPVEHARRLHAVVPTSELVEVPGAGHEVMFFHPDVLMRALRAVVK